MAPLPGWSRSCPCWREKGTANEQGPQALCRSLATWAFPICLQSIAAHRWGCHTQTGYEVTPSTAENRVSNAKIGREE